MMNQREFFDSIAEKWDSIELEDIRKRLDRVVSLSHIEPGMEILDVGTGTGALIPSLLDALDGTGTILAIDISPEMLKVASGKGFPAVVTFTLADIETVALSNGSFDRVMCNAVYPHFSDKALVLKRIYRMLKPGGMVVISHPTGREFVNKIHSESGPAVAEDRVPTLEKMSEMLEAAGFEVAEMLDEPEFYLAIGVRKQKE